MFLLLIVRSSEAWHWVVVSDDLTFTLCLVQIDHVIQNLKWDKNIQRIMVIKRGKAITLQAWTGPEGSRKLRLPDLKTIGT
jgi:hypothetical protein